MFVLLAVFLTLSHLYVWVLNHNLRILFLVSMGRPLSVSTQTDLHQSFKDLPLGSKYGIRAINVSEYNSFDSVASFTFQLDMSAVTKSPCINVWNWRKRVRFQEGPRLVCHLDFRNVSWQPSCCWTNQPFSMSYWFLWMYSKDLSFRPVHLLHLLLLTKQWPFFFDYVHLSHLKLLTLCFSLIMCYFPVRRVIAHISNKSYFLNN